MRTSWMKVGKMATVTGGFGCDIYIFLASVNASGNACPMGLKLIACLLLMEITTFLRECYKTLPKPTRAQARSSHFWCDSRAASRDHTAAAAPIGGGGGGAASQSSQQLASSTGRRWSMAICW